MAATTDPAAPAVPVTADETQQPTVVGEETERIAPVATPRTRRRGLSLPRFSREPQLLIGDGEDVVVLRLREGLTRIGRSFQAEIELDDQSVSRRHAMIVRDDNGVRILDDRSRNGVRVNGKRVSEARLKHGDMIMLGRVELRYVAR